MHGFPWEGNHGNEESMCSVKTFSTRNPNETVSYKNHGAQGSVSLKEGI